MTVSERKILPRRTILPLENLVVGDHFHFAYRVVNAAQIESAPSWIVTQITEDFYQVKLTRRFIAAETSEPGSIEMKVPKSTMVALCEQLPVNADD